MHAKIRHLLAFDATVRLGSFIEAARALHVTPAALSLTIRELEAQIGFRVLERTTRRLRLTEAGRGYLVAVQRVLSELEAADRYVREVRSGYVVVRIATTQTILATLLAHALPDVIQTFPHVRVQPLDVPTSDIPDSLRSRQAEIAIGVDLPVEPGIETDHLFTSTWHAYLSPAHPLGQCQQLDWSQLQAQSLYMTQSSRLKLRVALGEGFDFPDVRDSATATSGITLAAAGTGIAVFPGYAQPVATMIGLRSFAVQSPVVPHALQIGIQDPGTTTAPLRDIKQLILQAVVQRCSHLQ